MGVLAEWREGRRKRAQAARYVTALLTPPDASDLQWLLSVGANKALAQRALEFGRRAMGLIVAERDALNDQTAADVAHELDAVVEAEASRDAGRDADWSAQWRAYATALAHRGGAETPLVRLARVMLSHAGVDAPEPSVIERAVALLTAARQEANESLRSAYGAASLPEDVRPSAVQRGAPGS